MSTHATVWAWAQDLPPAEKLTLLALAEGANHQAQCWPSRGMLMKLTSLGETALASALKSLGESGFLQREAREGAAGMVFLRLDRPETVIQPRAAKELVPYQAPLDMRTMQDQAMVIWNEMAARTKAGHKSHRISPIRKLTDDMRRKLEPRLKEFGLEGWTTAVLGVEASAHCRGMNGWTADFHYLLQAKGFSKTVNGGWPADYEEKTNGGQRTGPTGRGDQRLDGVRGFDAAVRRRLAAGGEHQGGG